MSWSWKYRRSEISHTLAQTDLGSRPYPPVKYKYLAEYPVAYTLKVPKRHPPREK